MMNYQMGTWYQTKTEAVRYESVTNGPISESLVVPRQDPVHCLRTVASTQNARRCVSISLRTPEQIHLQRSTEHSQITMSPQYITKYRPEFRTRKHKYHRIQNAKNASKVKFPVQLQNK